MSQAGVPRPDVRSYPRTPPGWTVVDRVAVGPFTTSVSYVRPDGERVEWHSRAQRKHASRVSRARHGHEHPLWSPHRGSWWIAILFSLGSICFLVAPFPGFVGLVGLEADGYVFFVGSMLFTVAAVIQWLEAINADRGPTGADGGRFRLLAWEPGRVDWWSSGVQLIGTFFFDFTTFRALTVPEDASTFDTLVWRPDALGCVCFLVSCYLAYVEVAGHARPPRTIEGSVVTLNLLGCVAFGVSAMADFVRTNADTVINVTVVNVATALGALGFLIASLLLVPEGSHPPTPAPAEVRD